MSRQGKLNEGQVLLDDLNNYRPLDKPMVETTTKKAQQRIKTLLSEGHIVWGHTRDFTTVKRALLRNVFFTVVNLTGPLKKAFETFQAFFLAWSVTWEWKVKQMMTCYESWLN